MSNSNPEKVIREANTYSTFNELVTDVKPGVLTAESLMEAIRKVKKSSEQPFVTHMKSKYPFWKLFEKSPVARTLTYCGVTCIEDEEIPEGFIDIQYSDGKVKRIEMFNYIKAFSNPTITRI